MPTLKNNPLLQKIPSALLIASFTLMPGSSYGFSAQDLPPMQGTDTFLNATLQSNPRDRVVMLLQQEEVIQKLKEFGVSPAEAQARVASLSDTEIAQLNQRIDQAPAGAGAAGAILGTAFAVFLVLLITDILCVTKIFKFTRCAGS